MKIFYGSALDTLAHLDLNLYDLFYIDAAKKEYGLYYEKIVSQAKPKALLIIDNVLWKGTILQEEAKGITKSMQELNALIGNDPRISNFILPMFDGLNFVTIL